MTTCSTQVYPEDVQAIAPNLSEMSEEMLDIYIDTAKLFVDEGAWGDRYARALKFLAAHLATVGLERAGSGGAVSSERVGDLAVSYSNPTLEENSLGSTSYGQIFQAMKKATFFNPVIY